MELPPELLDALSSLGDIPSATAMPEPTAPAAMRPRPQHNVLDLLAQFASQLPVVPSGGSNATQSYLSLLPQIAVRTLASNRLAGSAASAKNAAFEFIRTLGFGCDALEGASIALSAQGLSVLAGIFISVCGCH